MAVEGVALTRYPDYFAQFDDHDALLNKYSLTQDQFSFLSFLIPLDYHEWDQYDEQVLTLHSHSLASYCLNEFPGEKANLFKLWKDAIDSFLLQTPTNTTILDDGCTAIISAKQDLEAQLCSSSNCKEEILTALNYNATLVDELIPFVTSKDKACFGISHFVEYYNFSGANTT